MQITNQLINLIKKGTIAKSTKLPGSRLLAQQLNVHRNTVVAAFDELQNQGWTETTPSKGTFISSKLPIVKSKKLSNNTVEKGDHLLTANYFFSRKNHLQRKDVTHQSKFIYINDGIPDTRIAPVVEIAKTYRSLIDKPYFNKYLSYGSIYGNEILREVLVNYLNETRGLTINIDNVLITRGSQMGIYLASNILLEKGQNIIIGDTNYIAATHTFTDAGGHLIKVEVDKKGINTNQIEEICKKTNVRAVYITPHHHHPTTVTLVAERRMHLLQLASRYKFAIIEDDYDFDFHYSNTPILPLASADSEGSVIYIGALCKLVAPSIRIGYMIAPKQIIDEAANLRRIIDRQGDAMMELVYAQMIKNGDIQRHSKKALKIYRERRDLFCYLLKSKFNPSLRFNVPEGGMAVWATLDRQFSWVSIRKSAFDMNLIIENHTKYDPYNIGYNGIRMGFASLNSQEINEALNTLLVAVERSN